MSLDILFSDHNLSKDTLQEFGEVVRSIHRVCEDGELCFWSFISYIATHHADILGLNLRPEDKERCAAVLARANPPPVTVRESERQQLMRELLERGDSSETGLDG
jgi:hypothetical protein